MAHGADASKVVHRPLGLTRGTRGVNDHGQVVVVAQHITLQGSGAGDDVVPAVIGRGGGQGQSDARHVFRHTGCLFMPLIEFPNEQQAGLTVLQHKLHCVCAFGGEDGHGGVTRHPNRHFGHEKVRTIFRQDGHFGTMGQPQGFQMRGHAARLVHRLRPGVVQHFAAAHRLGQEDFVSEVFFMLVNAFQHGCGGGSHGCLQGGVEVYLLYKTHSSDKALF